MIHSQVLARLDGFSTARGRSVMAFVSHLLVCATLLSVGCLILGLATLLATAVVFPLWNGTTDAWNGTTDAFAPATALAMDVSCQALVTFLVSWLLLMLTDDIQHEQQIHRFARLLSNDAGMG